MKLGVLPAPVTVGLPAPRGDLELTPGGKQLVVRFDENKQKRETKPVAPAPRERSVPQGGWD